MKTKVIMIAILLLTVQYAWAVRPVEWRGCVVDETGKAVEYATVVLLKENCQVAGTTTGQTGDFVLKIPMGTYAMKIQCLGYETVEQKVEVAEVKESRQNRFSMKSATTRIDDVVVKARLVRREADRFVMDVANAPAAIGKDGIELLERAPGVWVNDEKISINGKGGTKVFINDRELRLEPEQLAAYLRSLRAEEIQKIEVVPVTGADHDADASGGIIRITLRKQRENGVQGSVSMRTQQSDIAHDYYPGANVAAHTGKWDLNASARGSLGNSTIRTSERTDYTLSNKQLTALSEDASDDRNGGATLGAIVSINDRHSLGAELSYLHLNTQNETGVTTDLSAESPTKTASRYIGSDITDGYEGTFNYVWKIDTLGSTFKVLGDYAHRNTGIGHRNRSLTTGEGLPAAVDSLYRDRTRSSYDVAALTLALEKNFSPRWSLKTGAKYTRNEMRNDALYEYSDDEAWVRNNDQSFVINYTEHIAAAYGVVTANIGSCALVAGLRGEYTHTYGRNDVGQDYLSLFPNANISWQLSKERGHSIVAQYARTIERPRFWCLTPQRTQISDYTYQTGNPLLKPSYKQDISLTLVLGHKYTLTGGVELQKDEINQTIRADADNPDMLGIHWVNFDNTKSWYASVSLPFQPTKWMQLNIQANYMRRGQRLEQHAPESFQNILMANAATTITLPANFFIDLSYSYQGRVELGNVAVKPMHLAHAAIKKRFGEHFTLTCKVANLTDSPQRIEAKGEGFVRNLSSRLTWCSRSYVVGLTYNFKAGKAFRQRSIEAGAAEDKGRM